MVKVAVSVFKAKLSAYVRRVRKGEEFLILDHNVPVARMVPVDEVRSSGGLLIHIASRSFSEVNKVRFTRLDPRSDSASALQQSRDER